MSLEKGIFSDIYKGSLITGNLDIFFLTLYNYTDILVILLLVI